MMKWLTSLFIMAFLLVGLVSAKGLYINVLAINEKTPSGYSADGVQVAVYDANKQEVIEKLVTTKEGAKFFVGEDKKFYVYSTGSVDGLAYGQDKVLYAVDIEGVKLCRSDGSDCQSGYEGTPTIVLKAYSTTPTTNQPVPVPTPKPVEKKPEYQNTVYVTIMAVDEKTESYRSNPGVLVYVVDANSGSILGSGVTDEKGVSIAVLVDTKFRVYSKDSKDGRAYGYVDITYYLQKSTTGYMTCQSSGGCENSAELYIKAHPTGSTTTPVPVIAPIIAKEYKDEERIGGVYVIALDENGKPAANTKISMVYSQTGASGGNQITSDNGDTKFEVKTGRIFYFIADGRYYSNKYVVKYDGGNYKLCDLSGGDYCINDLTVKLYLKYSASPTSVVKIPEITKPIAVPTSEYGEYSLGLSKGWNLVSVPLTSAKVGQTNCDNAKVFAYNPLENKYRRVSLDSLYLETMQAFWIKAKDECKIAFVGTPFKTDDIEGRLTLFPGWNMIGAARDAATWDELKGSCEAKSGPWSYNSFERKWERAKSLIPGAGYLVKVVDKCSLGNSGELPPLPPGDVEPMPRPTPAPQPSANTIDKLMDDDPVIGSAGAPIVIVEFGDFQCPFCSRFYQETLSQLENNYINNGRVQLVYRDYPLSFHQNAQKAAEAAECAEDQGKWREMHNLLFDKQNSWKEGGDSIFKEYAASLGLDKEKFNNCIDSGLHKGEVLKDFNDGSNAGVAGTPTFFIGKRGSEAKVIVGAQAYSEFKKVIEELN